MFRTWQVRIDIARDVSAVDGEACGLTWTGMVGGSANSGWSCETAGRF